ncbi:uncharacterized protein LOC144476752 [Augochlora pura]
MFARRRRATRTSNSKFEVTSLVARQMCLVALLVLGAISFSIWSRVGSVNPTKFVPPFNIETTVHTGTQETPEIVEQTENVASSLSDESASSYCQIASCLDVVCIGSPDAGAVASQFLETVFKATCETSRSVKLSLTNCKFPENALRKNWLTTNLSIEELKLSSCLLRKIEDEAFCRSIFETMGSLILLNNNLSSLSKASFQPLSLLKNLVIEGNTIKQADWDLLESAADSLESLNLNGAIADPEVLRNITRARSLRNLLSLYLERNDIPEISDETFLGLPKVQALYLTGSNVRTLSAGSLNPMSTSIQKLIVRGNRITSLPQGLLDGILYSPRSFFMGLADNQWNCDCDLQWVQDVIKNGSMIQIENPTCASPTENAGKSFTDAKFCRPSDTSTSLSSTEQSSPETTTEAERITVNCSLSQSISEEISVPVGLRRLLTSDLRLTARLQGFSVESVTDQSIMLKLPSLEQQLTLLWFESGDAERSVSCARHVSHIYQVQNIDPQTTYTLCLLNDNEDTLSPLNCLAATTLPPYMSRPWLANKDKPEAIVVLTVTVILVFILGVVVAYFSIRKHPALLRGSKRVMLVKKNIVDAIVLPKGVNVEEQRTGTGTREISKLESGYITPLPPAPVPPPRVQRISRVSFHSDWNSYMSEVDASESQPASWIMNRANSEMYTPPLPPRPLSNIPSLSFTVEGREEGTELETIAVEMN